MFNLFLTFLFEINSEASEYQPLKDQTWLICNSESFTVQDYTVNYKICSKDTDVPTEQDLISLSKKILEFAETQGLPTENRVGISLEELEIYKINMALLNDSYRFSKWANQSTDLIWGLYDPRIEETGVASIMLTEHGSYWDTIVLAHELSHYWYDRLSWKKIWSKDDEQFALDFEKYLAKG